jgi:asparagine synthase (glutamine-hydrolysing)
LQVLNNTDDIFFSHLCRWSQYDQVISYFNIKKNSKSILNTFKKKLNGNFKSYDLNLKAQELEIKSLLSNYLLSSQGDRMSMANSVEGRYPYLDDSFVQKIRTIHPTYLSPGIKSKFLFRKTFEKYLPKEIVYRSKFAYQAPEAHAFVGPNYKSDLFIDFHDNIKKLDMINNKNFSGLLEKIQHPMSTQRLGFRENMSFIIGLSLHCLKSNSNKWLIYE